MNINNYYKIYNKILKDKNLTSNDKIIFSLISNLSELKGFCWASNDSISNTTGISVRSVQNSINKLIRLKYIIKWKKKKGTIIQRFLTTNDSIMQYNNNLNELIENSSKIELFDYNWLEDSEDN